MDYVFLIEKPAREIDLSDLHITIDFAQGVVHSVDLFKVKQAVEGLCFLVDLRDVVMIMQCEFIQFFKQGFIFEGAEPLYPLHDITILLLSLINNPATSQCPSGNQSMPSDKQSMPN